MQNNAKQIPIQYRPAADGMWWVDVMKADRCKFNITSDSVENYSRTRSSKWKR